MKITIRKHNDHPKPWLYVVGDGNHVRIGAHSTWEAAMAAADATAHALRLLAAHR